MTEKMRSKRLRIPLIAVLVAAFMLLMTACDSGKINTSLQLDESFSGQRVMSFDILVADLPIVSLVRVPDVVEVLEDNCPAELVMATEAGKTGTKCIFTLSFANKTEYETKLAALLGRQPTVNYSSPSDDVFTSGITLSEDFTSADLFGWAEDALREKYSALADKVGENISKGTTEVVFEGATLATDSRINVAPVHTTLSGLTIMTTRYGEDDYARDIYITVEPSDLALMGKDRFVSTFCEPIAQRAAAYATGRWDEATSSYVLQMPKSSRTTMADFTAAVFPGSTAEYTDLADGAFTESSALSEYIALAGYPCGESGNANVNLIYTAGDDTIFSADSIGDGDGGQLSSDKKSLTYSFKDATGCSVGVVSETRYSVDHISVETELSLTGKLTQSVVMSFPQDSSRSAAARAQRFLSDQYAAAGIDVTVEKITDDGGAAVVSGASASSDIFALVLSASGTPEEVSAAFTKAFGTDETVSNSFETTGGSKFSFSRTYNVNHKVDITALAEIADYSGEYSYFFSVPMSTFSIAEWHDYAGNGSDILLQRVLKEKISSTRVTSPSFFVTMQYSQVNLPFIVGAVIALIAACGALMLISAMLSAGLKRGRTRKKDNLREEAVKCVALALVPEDKRGELSTIPPELLNRPTAVISPRSDDGLDEPEDEPEGMMLFTSTLRILLVALIALFFFPFTYVSSTLKTIKISGLDLFLGKEVFGTNYPADRVTAILVLIPLVMLIALYARNMLPRIITPLFITGASLWQVYYLYRLPETLDANMDIIRQMVTGYVTDPSKQMQMAHTYSMVIYVLIAMGGILLLFSDLGMIITRDKRADECA